MRSKDAMPNDGGPKRPRIYDDDDEDDAPTRIMMRPLAFPRSGQKSPEWKLPDAKRAAAPKPAAGNPPTSAAPRPTAPIGASRPLTAPKPAAAPAAALQRTLIGQGPAPAPSQLRRLSAPPPSNRKPPLGATTLAGPSRESARPPPVVAKRTAGEVLAQRQKPSVPPQFEGTMVMERAPLQGLQPGGPQFPAPSAHPPPVQARPQQQFQQPPVQYSPQPPAVQYGHSAPPPMVHSPQPAQYGHGRVYSPHLSPSAPQVFVPAGAPALVRALESGVDGAVDRGVEVPTSTGSLIGWIAYTTPLLIATLAVASLALK